MAKLGPAPRLKLALALPVLFTVPLLLNRRNPLMEISAKGVDFENRR
jgi:hypothetical protein